uniref:protein disulfide-isomerase n=1 Tax=Strix occidentalis caurina TaxID=311401 RepID=A0A8D0FPV4_STROC
MRQSLSVLGCEKTRSIFQCACIKVVAEQLKSRGQVGEVYIYIYMCFYAPWCGHCKKLEPVWNEVGIEMKNMGSPVKVGKMDATSFSSIASEFGVRGYPTIKLHRKFSLWLLFFPVSFLNLYGFKKSLLELVKFP